MELQVAGSADANLIEKWDTRLKSCQQARLQFEKQWHENMSFYFGRQWIVTATRSGGFAIVEQPKKQPWRVRNTTNKILPRIRIELTKLSKEEGQWFCLPQSTDESDRLAAMAGDAISDYILRTRYFNRKRLEATLWALLCGTGYIKNYYDPHKTDIDGLPGKIDFEAVTAFHLLVPNLHVTDIEGQPYIAHVRTMNPEDVENCYGVTCDPDTDATNMILDSRFMSAIGIKNAKSNDTKQCFVKEVYVKPCRDFEYGAMFVYANNKVLYVYEAQAPEEPLVPPAVDNQQPSLFDEQMETLEVAYEQKDAVFGQDGPQDPVNAPKSIHEGGQNYNHEFPYRHGQFPFAKIDHIPTGMYYGESVIKTLIPLQKEYNRTRSVMLEWRNKAGKPQYSYVRGAFDPRKFTDEPGILLPIQMGFDPPTPIEQPPMPPNVGQELEITIRDMDESSNQGEIAKGQVPPGIEAASAIAYLSEENDSTLYHTVQSLENAVQVTGIQVLANVHDYWPEERIVRATSRNQYLEVREFKRQDLRPIMDFRVEPGSMAPRSLAAKQAFITELIKTGVISPDQGLRYLQMSETNKLYEDLMLDVRHVQRENVIMSQGQALYKEDPNAQQGMDPMTGQLLPPQMMQEVQRDPVSGEPILDEMGQPQMYQVTINPFDDHEIHISEHQKFQKTQEYELLDAQTKKIIQDHVDEHKMEMLKERNAVQADQAVKGETEETPPPRELEDQPEGVSPNGSGY